MDLRELARLQAVEAAVKAEVAKPGAITKTEIRRALATPGPYDVSEFADDDFSPDFD